MTSEEEETLPGVLEGQRDLIDGVRLALAALALRTDDLRPLRRAGARQVDERMLVGTRHDAGELALVVDPRSVQHFHVTQAVGKDHPLAVTVIAVINEGKIGR